MARSGITIVISSHLLSEIEAACSQVVIIRFGEMLFSGPLAELMAATAAHVEVAPEHTGDLPRLLELYGARGWSVEQGGSGLVIAAPAADAPELNRAAAQAGITLRQLSAREETLEDVFLRMTGETDGDNALTRSRQRAKRGRDDARESSPSDKEARDA